MKTLKELGYPQNTDIAKYPDGRQKNETDLETGTPVVEELYGDLLVNIYKIIRDAGLTFTETEDGEHTQYQLLNALKVFANDLNDKRQIISVAGSDLTLSLNFDNLPENYVFIGKISDALSSAVSYTLNGSGAVTHPVNSLVGMDANSLVLLVINSAGCDIYNLSQTTEKSIGTSFGSPLSFNDSDTVWYFSNGYVFSDYPQSYNVQNIIQVAESNINILVLQAIVFKGKLLCFTYDTVAMKYQLFAFDMSDLSTLESEVALADTTGTDNEVYMYCDGTHLYFTNTTTSVNDSVNNYDLGKFSFDENTLTAALVSGVAVETDFEKTSNVFIGTYLYTFVNGYLYRYTFGGGKTLMGYFNALNGQVFKLNGLTYYSNGETAVKWQY